MPVAAELAAWTCGLRSDDLPEEVRRAVDRHVLDALGAALAARRTGSAEPALTVAYALGGPPEAQVVGGGVAIGAPAAALATGALVHALDFDDTHAGGLVHASAVVVPAVLAVGQQVGASGEELVTAAAIGYELICRLAAASPHGFHARGLHATGIVGPLAAAAVAGRLLGLDPDTLTDALGIAGSSAAGLLEFLGTGAATKQLHPGMAAANGILAARLAAAGATGPGSVLEGRFGIFASMSARPVDLDSVLAGLGRRWEATRITVKPYPACQLLHATLDAAIASGVPASEIDRVVVSVHPDAMDVVCEPRAAKVVPTSSYEAKFSLPWSTATAFLDGRVDVDSYRPPASDRPEVRELAGRIDVAVTPMEVVAADAPGRVRVVTRAGRCVDSSVLASIGTPARPLPDELLVAKFRTNIGCDERADAVLAALGGLGERGGLGQLPDPRPLLDACAVGSPGHRAGGGR
jgi:2-methylcitrate dehydratase PrpD